MIEIAKLEKMVRMEVAADSWWHDLSKKEQQAYIKAHPGSKFAKSHKLAGGNANAKQTAYHAAMTDSHSRFGLAREDGQQAQQARRPRRKACRFYVRQSRHQVTGASDA